MDEIQIVLVYKDGKGQRLLRYDGHIQHVQLDQSDYDRHKLNISLEDVVEI